MIAHRPFMRDASRHAMAIKALDPADWIAFGEDFRHQMQTRRRLLDERPDDVLAALPGSEAGQTELLALLLEHLERHAGDLYDVQANAVIEFATGSRWSRRDAAPLALVGRLAQEDFCILQRDRDQPYRLTAAVLCFPGHWSLAEKLGRPLIDIHEPVPGFAEQLGDPVQRLFEKLDPARPVQRLNWSLVDTDTLFLPPAHRTRRVTLEVDDVGKRIRLRVERQTLRRLPVSGAVVFGIRTYVTPLEQAIDTAEAAEALIARLNELPEAVLTYKNLVSVRQPLLAYLERFRASVL